MPLPSAPTMLGYTLPGGRQGETLEIPLFTQEATQLSAWQFALHYDTTQLKIKNVRWAMSAEPTPYEMADWHSPASGELRLCWFDRRGTAIHLPARSPIAYLQVEWLGYSHSPKLDLELLPTIPGEGYTSDGQISAFAMQEVAHYQVPAIPVKLINKKQDWTVLAYPNPTNGLFRFEISLSTGGAGQIGLYDPLGRQVAQQGCNFTPGLNVVTSEQFPPLGSGIYFVRFDTPLDRQTLRLVKN